MTAQDWFLAGSLLLNVVLLVVVFFKTALNEMLVSGFKARADRRRSTRDLMVQLYGRVQQFDANYLLLLMANA